MCHPTGNVIAIPFAFREKAESGVNISANTSKIDLYLQNAAVALVSAKHYNPDDCVAFVSNLRNDEMPRWFTELMERCSVVCLHVPYDRFLFPDTYKWSLAFYKLCVLSHLADEGYQNVCYMDTDVYIQSDFGTIWEECGRHMMMYDINHGRGVKDYCGFCDEVDAFLGAENQLITHYGGEFFAASREEAKIFVGECQKVYSEMIEKGFQTTKGDEFIISIAASRLPGRIKNAGAYVYRFWTDAAFHLISTNYEFNPITVLHVPAEKQSGMLRVFDRYVKKGKLPERKKLWKMLGISVSPRWYRWIKLLRLVRDKLTGRV